MGEWVRETPRPAWRVIPALSQILSMCIIVHAKICVVTSLLTQRICERSWQMISSLFELQARLLSLPVPNSVLWAEHLVRARGSLREVMRAGLCLLPGLLPPAAGLRQRALLLGMGGGDPLAFPSKGNLNSQGMFELGQLAQSSQSLLMRWCLQLTVEKTYFPLSRRMQRSLPSNSATS